MTAYDSENNALYYFDNATNGSLYVYFIDEKSSEEVCEVSELLPSDDNNAILYGFVTNPYTEDVYLCGYEGAYEGMWLLNLSVESEEVHEFPNYRLSISDNIFFVSEDTFYYCQKYGASGKIVDISDSSETDVSLIPDYEINGVDVGDYRIDYLFEYGDCFYGIVKYGTDFYSVLKLTNLYDCEYEELGTLKADNADSDDLDYTGFYFTDNTLYYKDENNNIYTVNLDDFSTDIQTESSLFEKNSKDFLSSKCSDLAVTKNGDIITYDSSDNQLKIIEK
jgi:hypothetical protein